MDQPVPPKRGPGRPRHVPPVKSICVSLTEEQAKLVRMWGRGDLSAGLRWLIEAAAPLIRRAGDEPGLPRGSE